MLIKSVAIKNFRCIKDLTVELDDLTAFVGRNGSGKSTTLHALNAFYDIRASITEHDFFNGDVSQSIEITVEYRELSDEEVEAFSAHFNGESFAVTKVIRLEDGKLEQKYFAATRQIPQISKIKGLRTVTDKRNAWNDLVDTEALPGIGPKSQRGDDPGELMDSYEQEHPDLLEWVRQEVQFLGPANIGGGKLDKFTKFVYVPAVRDASDDSNDKKGSPLFQLMDYIVMRRFRARTDVRALQEDFSQRLAELYKPDKLTEYNELAAEISQTLQLYVPNAELRLRVTEPTLPDIPNPATFAELTEDEYSGSIDRKGHGLQRTLIFSLLQHLAVAVPIEPETEELEGEDVAPTELQASALSPDSRVGTQNAGIVWPQPHSCNRRTGAVSASTQGKTLGTNSLENVTRKLHGPWRSKSDHIHHTLTLFR